MRCYHFGNYYLSSIQQGIQAAHAQMELFVKYKENIVPNYTSVQQEFLFDWAKNHKTMVCLNGGNNKDLLEIKELLTFNNDNCTYPWSYFCEDEDSLGAVITNVSIVLPEKIYETAAKIRNREFILTDLKVLDMCGNVIVELTEFEVKLIETLNKCQLAK